MSRWLERLRSLASESLATPAQDGQGADGGAQLGALTELGRKTARAVTKLEARLESVEAQLSELVAQGRRRDDELFLPLMDALDALEAARVALSAGHHEGTEPGLAGIQQRLGGVLERAGYTRHAAVGVAVDGRLQRVVGAQADELRPNHSVARVVRAAITRGDALVRSGEVIAVRNAENSAERSAERSAARAAEGVE